MIQKDFKSALYNGYVQIVLRITEKSIDKINNTSVIDWELWIERLSSYTYDLEGVGRASVWIDGETVFNKNVTHDLRNQNWQYLGKGTKTIKHDEDGEKSFTVSARFLNVAGLGDINWYSGTVTLTKIERESRISNVTATYIGQPVTVEIARALDTFTHQFWYRINDSEWFDLGSAWRSRIEFTPPLDLIEKITSSDTGSLDLCLRTFQNGKQIGVDNYRYEKIKVPEDVVPNAGTLTVIDLNGKVANLLPTNQFLANVSTVRATIDGAKGVKGSTIVSYKINFGNQIVHNKSGDFTSLKPNKFDIVAEVTDSRGRTATTTQNILIHNYHLPQLNYFVPMRSGNGTNKNIKANLAVTVAPTTINSANFNEYKIIVEYSKRGTEQWTIAYTETTNQLHYPGKIVDLGSVYELSDSYDFRVTVTDKYGYKASAFATVRTARALAVFSRNGFHLGGLPEPSEKDFFTSTLPSKFKNTVNFDKELYYKSKPIQVHQLTSENGGAIEVIGGDVDKLTDTGIYSIMNGKKHAKLPRDSTQGATIRVTRNGSGLGEDIFQECLTDNAIFYRSKITDKWSDWKIILDNKDWWIDLDNFQNGWKHHGEYGTLQYRLERDTVHLRGNIWKGSNEYNKVAFILPESCRPKKRTIYLRALNNDYKDAIFVIYENGEVRTRSGVTSNWVNFDNISFKV